MNYDLELELNLAEQEAREAKLRERPPLSGMHTGTLMRMRKQTYVGSPYNGEQGWTKEKGHVYGNLEIIAELSKREHVPNKADRKAARRAAAKRGK